MVAKIRVLDDLTINKIAAGEVIENPSSVVKELVENALDAGADEILIEAEAGGRTLIRVSDNGSGMGKDDALLSLERHATSKLKRVEDLNTLLSMGFRGEALPSIASVSKTMLLTAENSKEGTLVKMEGGKLLSCSPASRQKGTTVEVRDLFFNVPARRKFLKSPASDENEIVKHVILEALAHPNVKFQLIFNQKPQLLLHPTELSDRIEGVLGSQFREELLPLHYESGPYTFSGFIGKPLASRPNRNAHYLILNGRPVTSPFISWCVKEAYSTHLATGRQPLFVLHLTLPTDEVDVNVHPQKREVRLRSESEIKRLLFLAIHEALAKHRTPHPIDWALPQNEPPFIKAPFSTPPNWSILAEPLSPPPFKEEQIALPLPTPKIRAPLVLTTLKGFILAEQEEREGLSLIDPQRAFARIVYERLQNSTPPPLEVTPLLLPLLIELDKGDMSRIKEHLESFEKLGFELREFGPGLLAIEAYPALYNQTMIEPLILAYLEEIKESSSLSSKQEKLDCKLSEKTAALTLNKERCLTRQEAERMVSDLYRCENPFESPTGKPTLIHLSRDELIRNFSL